MVIIRQAIKDEEIKEVFAIRKEVFIDEQKIFQNSDIDENDKNSIYLIAEDDNIIIGTVRIYPSGNDDTWVGGRLAVRNKHRGSRAASLLSQEAVNLAKIKGCRKFVATIQEQNVNFFKRLGWKTTGGIFNYLGVPHQPMEADLNINEKKE
jgi:putative N-acetyltransferase (TIGR04045 family)